MASPPHFTSASAQSAGSGLTLKAARPMKTDMRFTRNAAFPKITIRNQKAGSPGKRAMTYMSLEPETAQ
jgi:hypothetical protein